MPYNEIRFSENARWLMEQANVSETEVAESIKQSDANGEVKHLDSGTGVASISIEGQPIRVVLSETPVGGGKSDASVIAAAPVLS